MAVESENPVPARLSLSPREYADRTGLSLSTVRRYLEADRIQHDQPGGFRGRVLIPVSELPSLQPLEVETENPAPAGANGSHAATSAGCTDRKQDPLSGPLPRWRKQKLQTGK